MHRDAFRAPSVPVGLVALESLLSQVKLRAYEIHRDRVARQEPGDVTSDWKVAEQEVLSAAGLLTGAGLEEEECAAPAVREPEQSPFEHQAIDRGAALERMAAALASLTARDIMHGHVGSVGPDCTLGQLARTLDERGVPAVPVVDGRQRLLGVVSVTDLVHGAAVAQASAGRLPDHASGVELNRAAGEMLAAVRVGEVCSRALVAAPPEAKLLELAALMAGHRVQQVLILDEERIVGLVTALDLVCALWSRSPAPPHYTVP